MSTANGIDKEFELPHASVARILKSKLPEGVSVSREAKQAFSKSAGIFILYLTAASNEFCKDSKRQTLSAKDILEALRSLDFGDFIEPLEVALDDLRESSNSRKKPKLSHPDPEGSPVAPSEAKDTPKYDETSAEGMEVETGKDKSVSEDKVVPKEKQDDLVEKQDDLVEKQDDLVEKQDDLVEKQDDLVEKQDGLVEKQDEISDKKDTAGVDKVDVSGGNGVSSTEEPEGRSSGVGGEEGVSSSGAGEKSDVSSSVGGVAT